MVALGGTVGPKRKDGIVLGYNVAPGMLPNSSCGREEIVQSRRARSSGSRDQVGICIRKKENEDDVLFPARFDSIPGSDTFTSFGYDSVMGLSALRAGFLQRLEGLIAEIPLHGTLRFSCDSSFSQDEEAHPLSLLDMDRRFYMVQNKALR